MIRALAESCGRERWLISYCSAVVKSSSVANPSMVWDKLGQTGRTARVNAER